MSSNLFNENMTTNELRMALFRAIEGKTKEEMEKIFEEHDKIHPIVFKKEMDLAKKGWFID